ncbi:MAG: hypothetical protein ACRD1O_00850 [Terriglobia bacterium]
MITVRPLPGPTITVPGMDRYGKPLGVKAAVTQLGREWRRVWLETFANAERQQWKKWRGLWVDAWDDAQMFQVQGELRKVWRWADELNRQEGESRVPLLATIRHALELWAAWHSDGVPFLAFFQGYPSIELVPEVNLGVLRYGLAVGVSELFRRLYVCANPKCPRPYRIRERGDKQFYCNLAECRRMAELQKRRKWWAAHGGAGRNGAAKARPKSRFRGK